MKKFVSIALVLVLMLSVTAYAAPSPCEITVYVDDKKIEFDVPPCAENGRTLVPMRYIFEALGAKVEWIGEENRAVAIKDDIKIDLTLGSDVMYRNASSIKLDVPAKAVDGRTLVPARAVSEALDATVEWDPDTYTVTITSPEPYVPGEYHYTELSPKDMDTLRQQYRNLYRMYIEEVLYENMALYPEDVAELINAEDARIRMFADDVWNNLMAHTILNIQTESKDMYIFDIPEDVEIDSYSLMSDYIALTESEDMSSESVIISDITTTPKGRKVLHINYNMESVPLSLTYFDTIVVPTDTGFRYFYTSHLFFPARSSCFPELTEVTSEGSKLIDSLISTRNDSLLEAIDKVLDNEK